MADRRERIPARSRNALLVAIRAALAANQANIWTALPAVLKDFNSGKVTCSAQATLQAQIRQPDGTWVDTALPLCVDCPVMFPGGGGFVLTFPLAAGNEGLLIFASRCIDSWWVSGGIQKQAELRMHDLSDGFFLPTGGMSQAANNLPTGISADATELRNKDGTTVISLKPDLVKMSLNNGQALVNLGPNVVDISANGGLASLSVDGNTQRVNITALNGLWVNGVKVVVP